MTDKTNHAKVSKFSFYFLMSGAICSILGNVQGWREKYRREPVEILHIGDINQDGEKDVVIKLRGGYKLPMYGVRSKNPDSIDYIFAEEMKKRNPRVIIDYSRIEEMLNKEERKN